MLQYIVPQNPQKLESRTLLVPLHRDIKNLATLWYGSESQMTKLLQGQQDW